MKIYSVRYGDIVVNLVNNLVEIFKVNSNVKAHGRQEMLEWYLTFTEYLFKIGVPMYFISVTGYFIYPAYRYIYFREIISLLPTFLPFVDEKTSIGFVITLIAHLHFIVYALLGSSCSDFSFTMVKIRSTVSIRILNNNFMC